MADEEDVEVGAEENLSVEKAKEAKQLDAVTDYHDETTDIDQSKAQAAINSLAAAEQPAAGSEQARRAELSKIKVRDEDVQLLVTEMEVSEDEATLRLRMCGNDVKKALRELIRA